VTAVTRPNAFAAWPALAGFIEEQLWALRDRANALAPLQLPEPLAAELSAIDDELTGAGWLLRRTSGSRDGLNALIVRLRHALERIERAAWPAPSPVCRC
jgi:hypothetical protein